MFYAPLSARHGQRPEDDTPRALARSLVIVGTALPDPVLRVLAEELDAPARLTFPTLAEAEAYFATPANRTEIALLITDAYQVANACKGRFADVPHAYACARSDDLLPAVQDDAIPLPQDIALHTLLRVASRLNRKARRSRAH